MPELPEVETIRRELEESITGALIRKVDQRRPDLRIPFPEGLVQNLQGKKITTVRRRAKYILIDLDDSQTIVLHLGMAGRIKIISSKEGYNPKKHDHLILDLDSYCHVVFNDTRRFGMVFLVPANDLETHKSFSALGPEPLANDFSGPSLARRLKGKKTTIKQALLDQRIVAGIGNIYACEALFEAGISPRRKAASVQGVWAERLAATVKNVLLKAIEAGGSTLRDYQRINGELGYFQYQFSVYDQEGKRCPGCDCNIDKTGGIQRIVQSGRSTYYCPRKQR